MYERFHTREVYKNLCNFQTEKNCKDRNKKHPIVKNIPFSAKIAKCNIEFVLFMN